MNQYIVLVSVNQFDEGIFSWYGLTIRTKVEIMQQNYDGDNQIQF